MRFDREAPGQGMEIYTKLENGKALLEFVFYPEKGGENLRDVWAELYLYDGRGCCVLRIKHPLASEELARGLLLHPHLWNSVEDPYLYRAEAYLVTERKGGEETCDRVCRILPLCTLQRLPGRGWLLNGQPFSLKAVGYEIPSEEPYPGEAGGSLRELQREARLGEEGGPGTGANRILRDIRNMCAMGANSVYVLGGRVDPYFYELCCRQGLVVMCAGGRLPGGDSLPGQTLALYGELQNGQGLPNDAYYYYKAMWHKDPFVYLCRDSLVRQNNGLYQITAYSNLKKVALCVEGTLFEFQSGAPEFVFSDVQIQRFPAVLTAEADLCSMSVTVYQPRRS